MMDLEDIEEVRVALRFRGAQGTTGTQASFMEIFHNDGAKIDKLNEILCKKAGFEKCCKCCEREISAHFCCPMISHPPSNAFLKPLTNRSLTLVL